MVGSFWGEGGASADRYIRITHLFSTQSSDVPINNFSKCRNANTSAIAATTSSLIVGLYCKREGRFASVQASFQSLYLPSFCFVLNQLTTWGRGGRKDYIPVVAQSTRFCSCLTLVPPKSDLWICLSIL